MNRQQLKRKIIKGLARVGIKRGGQLRASLIREGRTRWLDVGSSKFDEGFMCLNLEPVENISADNRDNYFYASILDLPDSEIKKLGQFDLVRMQHVFEHFSFEEGERVLKTCAQLLKPEGYLLMTVPDLNIHVKAYRSGYRGMDFAKEFAYKRVSRDAPASFIFSIHVHQEGYAPNPSPGQAHKWCYDFAGVKYQLERCGEFKNIQELGLLSRLSETPFTHNRPPEDLCVLAQKK